ncbi:TIGR03617 family F420-dependent LLM class oxidoreductase [Mycolicibacillus parakoreensis]|uniref:TIGR03617 family F420-dependent LLM class oxidoreductase n=1 Tax=Mycolicibacillus parakoreensis TaxID=1069221 RepID=A0ABY3TWV1_9MYCO|nr:TIGR03617 family F420-dependent LLM class oxidoreductase [Mycolicibacillus parakoreensis]MCV7317015.1 TIGR03617 family F420-dependent LLM class oxidoreductase [Mycolicibacillus parakoreensis]ULN51349.1 TIGR03617 family F420-dependent LLM class oxidoreductase [Mycolicibacillus parakoreensis]
MRIHLQVEGAPDRAADSARQIERLGADGAFSFEGQHDVFFPLIAAAAATDLSVMTNVAIAGPRSPLHLAHAAYDLQCYSSGRFRLGLGSQIRVHIERRYGSQWGKPAARMGESVNAVKAIFAAWEGEAPLQFRGDYHTHTLMPPNFDPGPNPYRPPPVLMGALGPLMTRTAAETADGLLVMPFNSARHFADRTVPALNAGLDRSGRSLADFDVIAQAMLAVGRSEKELTDAIAKVAFLIAFYASTPNYRPVLEVEGLEHLQPRLNALSKNGDYQAMAELIDEEIVRTYGIVGTPQQCADQIYERYGSHASEVCCYFPGYDPAPEDLAELTAALHRLPPP